MTFTRKSGGTNVTLTTIKRRSAGAWVSLTIGKRRASGAWVDILPSTGGVTLTNKNLSATKQSPGTASVVFRLATGGKLRQSLNGGAFTEIPPFTEWLDPESTIVAEGFDAMAAILSNPDGATMSGSYGTWLQLGAIGGSRDWGASVTTSTSGASKFASVVIQIQIRRRSDLAVVATANVNISVEMFNNL